MSQSMKRKLSKISAPNMDLNRKALKVKRSWDEVAKLIRANKKK